MIHPWVTLRLFSKTSTPNCTISPELISWGSDSLDDKRLLLTNVPLLLFVSCKTERIKQVNKRYLTSYLKKELPAIVPQKSMMPREHFAVKDCVVYRRFRPCYGAPYLDRLLKTQDSVLKRVWIWTANKNCFSAHFVWYHRVIVCTRRWVGCYIFTPTPANYNHRLEQHVN